MSPDAYLLTFCTYGTHLPGDDRGSVTRHRGYHPPNGPLRAHAAALLKSAPVTLEATARAVVLDAMLGTAAHRGWQLRAAHVRTEHVHCVVRGDADGQRMLADFKAYATRALRRALLVGGTTPTWAQRGSARWLRGEDEVAAAARYVWEQQGEPMARYP